MAKNKSHELDIPEFLKLTPEQRRASWENRPLTKVLAENLTADQIFRRNMDAQYRRAEEERDAKLGASSE